MTAPTNTPTPRPRPVAGETYREVIKAKKAGLLGEGEKRFRTLALIAAYADAGQPRPAIGDLAERLNLEPAKVRALIVRLVQDGYLKKSPAKKRPKYTVVLPVLGGDR